MKIELEITGDNEGTSYPWWFIVRPGRGFNSNPENVAHCITGPFFSREEAEHQLNSRRYDYGKNAIVWCGSGYYARRYRDAFEKAIFQIKTKIEAIHETPYGHTGEEA